jgi:hypothetical protein
MKTKKPILNRPVRCLFCNAPMHYAGHAEHVPEVRVEVEAERQSSTFYAHVTCWNERMQHPANPTLSRLDLLSIGGHVVHNAESKYPLAWFALHADAKGFRSRVGPEFTITPSQEYKAPFKSAL